MVRRIRGLKWARELEKKPGCIPASRPRGVKAMGVRYERALAKALPQAEHGKWFEYEDENGHGFCQVDFMLNLRALPELVLLEAKYTWTLEGHEQLESLYGPVVRMARRLDRTPAGVLVCRVLASRTKELVRGVYEDLPGALGTVALGRRIVLQWLPGTPLLGALGADHGDAA